MLGKYRDLSASTYFAGRNLGLNWLKQTIKSFTKMKVKLVLWNNGAEGVHTAPLCHISSSIIDVVSASCRLEAELHLFDNRH